LKEETTPTSSLMYSEAQTLLKPVEDLVRVASIYRSVPGSEGFLTELVSFLESKLTQ